MAIAQVLDLGLFLTLPSVEIKTEHETAVSVRLHAVSRFSFEVNRDQRKTKTRISIPSDDYTLAGHSSFNDCFVVVQEAHVLFSADKKRRRPKEGHSGAKRSIKKRCDKQRATYSLTAVVVATHFSEKIKQNRAALGV